MGRSPCCEKEHTNKGAWTKEEDERLVNYIKAHGEGCWRSLPKAAGLLRCGKSCRLRWINYLRPDLKRGNFTEEEDELIINLHSLLGTKWSLIAARLPGRTDNEIKNYWNTHIRRKLYSRGIDPQTHRPLNSTATAATTTAASAALSNSRDNKDNNNNNNISGNNCVSKIETQNSPLAPFLQVPEYCISGNIETKVCNSSNIKIITDSSPDEDSNCSSGVTCTEEVYPEINLELSIGLPYNHHHHQISSINFNEQKKPKLMLGVGSTRAACLCCNLGFQNNQTCSCRVMETSLTTVDSFSRYFRPLNS
ncbi:hypothetical protein JCGZ_02792 [Jatropha curcas]|uniref:MYB family protein n=1 Tax=Jatropha curcas TaxID=180498 RepID=A0A067JT70_JATCU|nr:MYB family protein [Jatropha curcas]KDP22699.1 hypothetical protein JCGZ_02792 [Jatropha curcas]